MSITLSLRPTPTQRLPDSPPMLYTPPSNREVSALISAIAHTTLSPEVFSQFLANHIASTDALAQQLAKPMTEATIATQYGQTCISLWQLAQCQAQLDSPRKPFPQRLLPAFPQPLLPAFPQPQPKVSFAQQQFTQQLTKVCVLWAIGKWQQPTHAFFDPHPTAFATLQAKWQNPAIQAALREATTHLLQSPQERWIATHTDGWAYLLGRMMHQLLQWNYQLTPAILGELLQGDEGKPDDTKPDAR